MQKDLQQMVIDEFSSDDAVKKYTKEATMGLWHSEEKLIDMYFEKKSKILDIGCGTGRTTLHLIKKGYKITGLDLTPKFIEIAKRIAEKKKIKAKYVLGDATNLKYKNNVFDNVLFSFNGWAMIPGKDNRTKALEEVYRALKPNGYFIFTTHKRKWKGYTPFWIKQWLKVNLLKRIGFNVNEQDFGDRYFSRDSTTKYSQEQFIHIPNPNNIKKQLQDIGFKIKYMGLRSEITDKDNELKSGNYMFYVCQKL